MIIARATIYVKVVSCIEVAWMRLDNCLLSFSEWFILGLWRSIKIQMHCYTHGKLWFCHEEKQEKYNQLLRHRLSWILCWYWTQRCWWRSIYNYIKQESDPLDYFQSISLSFQHSKTKKANMEHESYCKSKSNDEE